MAPQRLAASSTSVMRHASRREGPPPHRTLHTHAAQSNPRAALARSLPLSTAQRTLVFLSVAAVTAACAGRAARLTRSESPRPTAAVAASAAWPGTFDLVGDGFPEGERRALLVVARRDTAYAVSVLGPPGHAAASHVAGDSAHVVWDFEDGRSRCSSACDSPAIR